MPLREPANSDLIKEPAWRALLRSIGGYPRVVDIAEQASRAIMEIYEQRSIKQEKKADGSPVSEADMAAAALIEKALRATGVPVVCEEGVGTDVAGERLFWLVDPLDGTKEFLDRNGEFTVNIALVSDGYPVVGVISIPAQGEVYVGVKGEGALRIKDGVATRVSNTRKTSALIAAVSRSYGSKETEAWLENFGVSDRIRCGSAIKFCRVAEGKADLYVRLGRTMEWDTGAGQVILEESGCRLVALPSQEILGYGKPDFANPDFVALRGDLELPHSPPRKVGNLP